MIVLTRPVRLTLDPRNAAGTERDGNRGMRWILCRIAAPPRGPVSGHRPLTTAVDTRSEQRPAELIGRLTRAR